ncbi:STAS domain-containing protein [Streptomyces aquilus]|uniref:STAS domain-containing protein n=1 Tax=Streptomyces aquilus TaxID=2548456 RepID=UPI0036B21C79
MTTELTIVPGPASDGGSRLVVAGEIDMSNVSVFEDALSATRGPLVVDLTAVEYLDSAGLNALFTHAERLELIVTPLLSPLMKVSGLDGLATVRERS